MVTAPWEFPSALIQLLRGCCSSWLPGAGTGTLQPLRFMVLLQLPALSSQAAAHWSGLKVAGDLSPRLRTEGVPTQHVDGKNARVVSIINSKT